MDKGRIGDRTGDLCLLKRIKRNKSVKEKIKSKKQLLIIGGILILFVTIGMAEKEMCSQQAQVSQTFQQDT